MALLTTGQISAALRPGINTWYGNAYNRYEEQWSKIFEIAYSDMNYEIDVNINGLGLAPVKPEGAPVNYDTFQQGWKQTYQHIEYALGFIITQTAIEDNLYYQLAKQNTEALAISMKQTKENVAANILNRAFSGSYVGADGVCLGSNAHLLSKGGTYSNIPASNAALSESSLEQSFIDIAGFVDDAGLRINAKPSALIVPRQLWYNARRILGSDYQNDTADNAINVIKSDGGIDLIRNVYLSSSTAWFVKTDVMNGLRYFERVKEQLDQDLDFDTYNIKYKTRERYSFGWTDPRGVYCVQGV